MTIQDHIAKHKLTFWRRFPNDNLNESWTDTALIDLPDPNHETIFEIYANEDKTWLVSLNHGRGKFRVVFRDDIAQLNSEWLDIDRNYVHSWRE